LSISKKPMGGRLFLAGRCLNGEFGIVIFYADFEKQAEDFMGNYAAIKRGSDDGRIVPFQHSA